MTENSSQHAYVTWTKQRLDEMDAALASIEAKASQLEADSKAKATQLNADMKKRRADFEAEVKANLKAGETALQASKTQLEKEWAVQSGAEDLRGDGGQKHRSEARHIC